MWSAFAGLALKHIKRDEQVSFDSWYSCGKGDGFAPQVNGTRYFSFHELKICTDNFAESNLIGIGGYGKVYKGYLPNGVAVAVKRAHPKSTQGHVQQFINEIGLLSRVHHKNIVSLVGFCFEQGERVLVYEYISKGSLDAILHGTSSINLEWEQRLKIALDIARGLAYLHQLVNPQIIHGDPKPSNILLDENLNAKITDFGLSKMSRDKEVYLEKVSGTHGYIDPVYLMTGRFSEKCDVYSLGIVILVLITGRRPVDGVDEEGMPTSLKEEVKTAIDQYDQEYYGLRDVIDPKIVSQERKFGLGKFVQLAFSCLEESTSDRPSMYEVMKEIEIILQIDGSG